MLFNILYTTTTTTTIIYVACVVMVNIGNTIKENNDYHGHFDEKLWSNILLTERTLKADKMTGFSVWVGG